MFIILKILTVVLIISSFINCSSNEKAVGMLVEAELISDVESISNDKPFWIGVKLKIKDGWHIYWRNPGDAGEETKIKIELPKGYLAEEINWPIPKKNVESGITEYIYENEVVLLYQITPDDKYLNEQDNAKRNKILIKANISWLACKEKCVAGKKNISHSIHLIADAKSRTSEWESLISKYREKLPKEEEFTYETFFKGNNIVLKVLPNVNHSNNITQIEFFPYNQGIISNSAKQSQIKDGNTIQLEIPLADFYEKLPERLTGVLVLNKDWKSNRTGYIVDIPTQTRASVPLREN